MHNRSEMSTPCMLVHHPFQANSARKSGWTFLKMAEGFPKYSCIPEVNFATLFFGSRNSTKKAIILGSGLCYKYVFRQCQHDPWMKEGDSLCYTEPSVALELHDQVGSILDGPPRPHFNTYSQTWARTESSGRAWDSGCVRGIKARKENYFAMDGVRWLMGRGGRFYKML